MKDDCLLSSFSRPSNLNEISFLMERLWPTRSVASESLPMEDLEKLPLIIGSLFRLFFRRNDFFSFFNHNRRCLAAERVPLLSLICGSLSCRLLFAEQGPGDVVFIPRGWWHCTLNLETSVAFTQNVVLSADGIAAYRELSAAPGQARAARLLHAVLKARHCDC